MGYGVEIADFGKYPRFELGRRFLVECLPERHRARRDWHITDRYVRAPGEGLEADRAVAAAAAVVVLPGVRAGLSILGA